MKKKLLNSYLKSVCVIFVTIVMIGCANMGVKPWQKGVLAKGSMQPNHAKLQSAFDDHIYNARESSSGGSGLGGGGCGCN